MNEKGVEAGIVDPFTFSTFSPEKWKYACTFDLHNWYGPLKSYTYKTVWFPLTLKAGKAVQAKYRHLMLEGSAPSDEEETILNELSQQLQSAIKQQNWEKNGAFVRLSSRSPKDVGLEKAFESMEEWKFLEDSLLSETDPGRKDTVEYTSAMEWNTKLRVLMLICGRKLVVRSGEEALSLLCRSERVHGDVISATRSDTERREWDLQLILRQWADVDPEREFRCFVSHGRLVACSQYNDMLYYPTLMREGEIERVVRAINAYFLTFSHLISHSLFVADFAMQGSDVILVELNPAGPMTGASLFNWNSDRDLLTSTDPSSSSRSLLPYPYPSVCQFVVDDVVFRCRCLPQTGLDVYWEMYQNDFKRMERVEKRKMEKGEEREVMGRSQKKEEEDGRRDACDIM